MVPDLATGYSFANGGKTFVIDLRQGVQFSDGTPFNAAAVAFSIRRDLHPKNACLCLAAFSSVTSVTTSGNDTVELNMNQVDAQIK